MRVEDDQVVVDGAERLGHCEGLLLVHVQAGGIRGQRHVHDPPAPWFLLSQDGWRCAQPYQHHYTEHESSYCAMSHSGPLLFEICTSAWQGRIYFSVSHTSSRRRFNQWLGMGS